MNINWLNDVDFYVRWSLDLSVGLGLVLIAIKSANRAYFPFSFAFFSGFNVLFISIATKAVLMLIFEEWVLVELPAGINESKWLAYSIFRESLSHFVIGIAVITLLAWVLKKKKNRI